MLTKHPSNTRPLVEEDEINIETATTTKNKSMDTSITTSVLEERVKAAAKLEGVSTDKILSRIKIANNNTNVTTNVSNNDRLSKESGIGSSVGSSFDERDDELDLSNNELFNSPSSTNTSVSTENTKISPRASESLDDLDDTMTKLTNENKNSLGIITEEEESNNNVLYNNISRLNHSHNHYNNNNNNNSFLKKHHQNRITFLDNLDSNSEVTESSTFNDTESSISGGEPDSPSLLNNLSIPVNNSSKIELEKRKNSFKRKNSGRSIFSVLSSSSLRSSNSSSTRDSQRGSLSDPEDSSSHHHHRGATMPGSPSKSDRILSRSGFSSLSIRRRRSKPILSVAVSDNSNSSNNNKMISTSRPGSPENLENLSKAGKILGLTVSEEKILLDKPVTKKSREVGTTSSSSEERILSPPSTKLTNSSKVNKLLGYDDKRKILNKQSKASKILGFDDHELNRRTTSMYVDKAFDLRGGTKSNLSGGSIGGAGDRVGSPITVASVKKNVIYKGFLTRYTNTNFVLSKSWKSRYFILAKNTLYCFKSSENNSQLIDQFELTANSVVCVSETFNKSWVLQVGKSNQKPWYIQADNVDDMIAWLTELKSIVVRCNNSPENLHSNSTDRLLLDDYDDGDDDDYDYDENEDSLNDNSSNHKNNVIQRTFSSPVHPTKIVYSPNLPSPSSSIDDNSPYSLPPPPRPSMKTSPRSKSAPSSPSCPPSPTTSLSPTTTSLSPPPRPMSPPHNVPIDIEELSINDNLEIPRSSSPVETLSPPRARFGDSTQSHQHNGSISSTNSRYIQRSNSANSSLSINTSIQQSSSHQSPVINNSPRRLTRNSSTSSYSRESYRESIPIMMPSWGLRTASPTSILNPSDSSLPFPSLSPPPSRNGQQIHYNSAHLTNLPKPPEGPKPPPRNVPDRHLTRSPPPNIPLPQPPPRPRNTLTSASRATSPTPRNNNHIIIPPLTSHPVPPPIPPPRRPSTDGRIGGRGTNSAVTNLPVPTQNMKSAEPSPNRRPSLHERTMTLPTNLPSCPPSHTILPARSRSPPPLRNNVTSMVYSSSPSRFQTMSVHLPSYVTLAPLPPPTRPPNVPLPPVPNQSPPHSMMIISSDTMDNKTQDTITSPLTTTMQPSIEFPDDDDLDPDYADELAASRIRSQKTITSSLPSSGTTYYSMISNVDESSDNHHQQLSASGLTFVMVEETLGDGELVLDLQDVSKDHPHIISRSSSRNNIHNDFLIRNDKEEKDIIRMNPLMNAIMKNSEGKGRENSKGKDKEMIAELEGKSVEGDTINNVINEGKVEIVNNSDKNNISPSMLSI